MKTSQLKSISENLIDTFNDAGKVAIDLYDKGLKIEIKEDKSPVSNGDLKVNELITNQIKKLTPNVPIVSEETVNLKIKNKAKIAAKIVPAVRAIRGGVFLVIKPITIAGTKNNHGLILKALSIGAKACSGGRLYLYGLASAGQAGVERALSLYKAELERDMKLMGCTNIKELNRSNIKFR